MINRWVEYECFEEVRNTHTTTGAETQDYKAACEVWKRYSNIIIEDRDLDSAPPETVRKKFQAWIESRGVSQNSTSRYRFCLVIDQDVLETLDRLPRPPTNDLQAKWQLYSLKVIDVEIDGERDHRYPEGYRSCMMTPPWMLAHLYFHGRSLCEDELRDQHEGIPVYVFAKDGALKW
jgi:hypothetical protein